MAPLQAVRKQAMQRRHSLRKSKVTNPKYKMGFGSTTKMANIRCLWAFWASLTTIEWNMFMTLESRQCKNGIVWQNQESQIQSTKWDLARQQTWQIFDAFVHSEQVWRQSNEICSWIEQFQIYSIRQLNADLLKDHALAYAIWLDSESDQDLMPIHFR